MGKNRLEAFSDGVIAIIITIMVLEMKAPAEASWEALRPLLPKFLAYVLSFFYVAIYWNNHHHMLHTVQRVSAGILWSNMLLLFCLSLFPLGSAWLGEAHGTTNPTVAYGIVLFGAGVAYLILQMAIIRANGGRESLLAMAIGCDWQGKASALLYLSAIGLAFFDPRISNAIYTLVALMWVVPDRRIERAMREGE